VANSGNGALKSLFAEDRGHHELLNQFCMMGDMHDLGRAKPDESVFLES